MARYHHSQIRAVPVAEGARFRIGSATAFAVRQESKDVALRIRREEHPVRDDIARIPFLRGVARLVGVLVGFPDAVAESGELEPQRIVRGTRFEQRFARLFRARSSGLVAFGSALAILLLTVGLVWAAPWALGRYMLSSSAMSRSGVNAAVCAVRVASALLAAALIPRLRVMSRFCMYRGAINQVLNGYEIHDDALTREMAAKAPLYTGRSDAAFALLVALLAIVAFTLMRPVAWPLMALYRLGVLLGIAAVLGELAHFLEGLPPESPLYFLHAPLRVLELLFVLPPHRQMIEVALFAFNAAREHDADDAGQI